MSQPSAEVIERAQRHARMSAVAGRPVDDCPYSPIGDAAERVLAQRWVRAFLSVKSDDDDFDEPAIDPDVQREVIARLGVDLDAEDDGEEDRILAAEFDRERLHHYWTRGKGLAKWIGSPHPWTTLYHHLRKHVGSERAKRMASEWLHEVTGLWAGSDAHRVAHGGKMRGNVIGPG